MSVQTWYIVVLFSQYLCKTKDESYCCAAKRGWGCPRLLTPHLPRAVQNEWANSPPSPHPTAQGLGLLCWAPDPGAAGRVVGRCGAPSRSQCILSGFAAESCQSSSLLSWMPWLSIPPPHPLSAVTQRCRQPPPLPATLPFRYSPSVLVSFAMKQHWKNIACNHKAWNLTRGSSTFYAVCGWRWRRVWSKVGTG